MPKIKAAVNVYRNCDLPMAMVCKFEERAEELGHMSLWSTQIQPAYSTKVGR